MGLAKNVVLCQMLTLNIRAGYVQLPPIFITLSKSHLIYVIGRDMSKKHVLYKVFSF